MSSKMSSKIATYPQSGPCADCGTEVSLYVDASWWLGRAIYVDENVLDYDNNGEACEDTGDVHRLEGVS